ncbi:MAG TPA: lysylphosphatidylglycerol synthase domain-containing protein, partial [Candidatus Eisenbacteria bacterium]|nr:lysylphosphatidylglycerol synthase domain-containing protein [Candidatus Eisenbacteria bacterium]
HTTFYLSLNAFLLGALAVTRRTHPLPPALRDSVIVFLVGLGICAGVLVAGLFWGLFRRLHAVGHRLRWWGEKTEERANRYLALDADIRRYFAEDKRRFWLSTAFNFAAWWLGTLEVWWAARLLGIPMDLGQAWLFEALIQTIRIVTFFIPASVGAQEGGIVFLFTQMGLPTPAGLALALLRRAREILWMGVGLLLWFFLREEKKDA